MQSNISTFSYCSFSSRFSHSLSSLAPNQQIYMTAPSLLVEAGTKRSAAACLLIKDSYRTICMHETKGFWLPTAQTSHCWAVWGAGSSLCRGEQGHDGPVESTVWQWCQAVADQKKKNKKKQVNVSFLNFQKGRKKKKNQILLCKILKLSSVGDVMTYDVTYSNPFTCSLFTYTTTH